MIPGQAQQFFEAAAAQAGGGDYKVDRSLRFNDADTPELTRTPSSTGNTNTFTLSFWAKRCKLGSTQMIVQTGDTYANLFRAYWDGNDNFVFHQYNGSYVMNYITSAKYRDVGAWYHIVIALDTTQAAAADRAKLYVNGVEITDFSATTNPALNLTTGWNAAIKQRIGREYTTTYGNYYNYSGYLAEFYNVDGQQLAASDFGEYDDNNVWQPKEYQGGFNDWFDTSQTWSGLWSGSVGYGSFANLHDTDLTNYMQSLDATLTLSSPIAVTSLRILLQRYGTTGTSLSINGTDVSSQLPSAPSGIVWVDITGVTSLTSLNVTSGDYSSNTLGLYAIEVNGKLLLDTGTSASNNGFYLNFSDNSSNAALGTDSSGNGNTFTVSNLEASGAFGIGTACSILTTSQTISFPITYAATVTYEFFTRVTTAATYTYFAYENVGNLWNLGINANGSMLFGNYNGGWTTFSSTGLNDGNWHFVRLTTTGSSTSLYIDGTLFATNASGGSASTGAATNELRGGAFRIAYMRITNGGTPPTTGIPALADMNQPAGSGGTLAFFDKLDDIAGSGTKTSDGGGVTITMSAATVATDTSGTDSLIDTPTNYTAESGNNGGNYCTLSPLINPSNGQTLKNGNLTCSGVSGRVAGTVYANTGKVYWEFVAGSDYTMSGIESSTCLWGATYPGENDQQYALYGNAGSGQLYHNGGTTSVDGFVSGDVIGVALDLDGGNLYYYKNGAAMNSGNAVATGLTGSWTANCRSGSGGYDGDTKFNFGQRPFAYTPPTGYVSLCTTNLTDPTIADGSTEFDTTLYSGNDTQRDITGLGFSPDFVWIKKRSDSSNHSLMDTVRGATKNILSNDTQGEGTEPQYLNAFLSDGFSLGTSGVVNDGSSTYVAWAWDGGDLATNSAYNQSAVWSSGSYSGTTPGTGYEVANAFNGSSSPGDSFGAGKQWGFFPGSGTLTLPTPITLTASSTVEFYTWHNTGSTGNITVTCSNGSVVVTPVDNANIASTTVSNPYSTFGASITAITVNSSGSDWTALAGVVIDGKILVDTGVIPVGSLNSSAYNQSQTWSDNVTGGSGAYGAVANAFNGSLSNYASPEYSSPMTYTNPSPSDTVIDTIELYLDIYTMSGITLELNDTDITSQVSTTAKWYTITGFSGTNFSKLYWRPTSGNYEVRLYAIRINGKILVDDDVTPTNVPSIANTNRANPTAGISIVTWVGTANANVAHGLNAVPKLVLTKSRTSSVSWRIWSAEFSNATADYLGFDTNAKGTFGGTYWGSMTTTTIGLGDGTYDNNTGDMVAYCFAPIEGFSSFGSYTGSGSSDGPFVFTGFKVAWLMIKNMSTNGETWTLHDSTRDVDNPAEHRLLPNSNSAESTGTSARYKDLLSNGFKIRGTSGEQNTSGNVYLYAAFAEHPFKTARAR